MQVVKAWDEMIAGVDRFLFADPVFGFIVFGVAAGIFCLLWLAKLARKPKIF